MVCASAVPDRARSPTPNASKRSRPRRAPCATIAARFITPVGLPLVEMAPSACRRAFEAIDARAAGDDCSGNGQVRGQLETTAATLAIPSGYVKPRGDAAGGIATRSAHTAATGVHVHWRTSKRELTRAARRRHRLAPGAPRPGTETPP